MRKTMRWATRPAKHAEFLVALETDPMFWGLIVAGTVAFVFAVVPYVFHVRVHL